MSNGACMRHVLAFVLAISLGVTPALAFDDDGTLACRLIDKSALEAIVGPTTGAFRSGALNICAGLCPSVNGSFCSIPVARTSWSVWLYQPPFLGSDRQWSTPWSPVGDETVERLDWPGGAAWTLTKPKDGRALLTVRIPGRLHLIVVQESGISDRTVWLSKARAVARNVIARFDAVK